MGKIEHNTLLLLEDIDFSMTSGKVLTLRDALSEKKKSIKYDLGVRMLKEGETELLNGAGETYLVPLRTVESDTSAHLETALQYSQNNHPRTLVKIFQSKRPLLFDVTNVDPLEVTDSVYHITSLDRIEKVADAKKLSKIRLMLS